MHLINLKTKCADGGAKNVPPSPFKDSLSVWDQYKLLDKSYRQIKCEDLFTNRIFSLDPEFDPAVLDKMLRAHFPSYLRRLNYFVVRLSLDEIMFFWHRFNSPTFSYVVTPRKWFTLEGGFTISESYHKFALRLRDRMMGKEASPSYVDTTLSRSEASLAQAFLDEAYSHKRNTLPSFHFYIDSQDEMMLFERDFLEMREDLINSVENIDELCVCLCIKENIYRLVWC